MSQAAEHSAIEDIQGIAFGVCMAAVGIHILTFMGFVAGQTAGVAALISYTTGMSFSLAYFLISLPFMLLAYKRMGHEFALKTLLCVTLLSLTTAILPQWISFQRIDPAFAAILYGSLFGIAALAVVRHGGSFGGISVLWLWLQDRSGFPAGYAQLLFDLVLFAVAALIIPLNLLLWSFLGAAIFNLFLAINHRRDRYIAT
ncbi:MAG: YitT family protein [Cypionkella sp.]|uniref:YitT family protein n=1 Tax=Cypionkella sp. TaxID=2811411 RepID=UPI00260897B5|nr:YitT family protein [Cypionkella sp.]MDB5658739.1 YitT family protein [Cypionkella sp.]